MAITEVTIIDEIRKAIDDYLTQGSGKFLTDAQIIEFVLKNARAETSYQFQRLADGYYSWPGNEYFFNPSFVESYNCDYVFNSSGSIIVTEGAADPDASPDPILAGDESRTSIEVTAMRINFNRIVSDLFLYFANVKAKIIAQSGDMGTISPNTVRQECMAQATEWSVREWTEW